MTYYLAMWDSREEADMRADDGDANMYEGAEPHGTLLLDVEESTIDRLLAAAYEETIVHKCRVHGEEPPRGVWRRDHVISRYQRWLWSDNAGNDEMCLVIREVTPI